MPTLKPVEALRERYLAGMVAGFAAERDAVRARLLAVACGTVAILVLLVALLQSLRASVLRPLLVARETAMTLAEGGVPAARPLPALRIVEIRRLFDALSVLEDRLRERARLMETLRRQAETGRPDRLSNRRGLALAIGRTAPERPAAALMIDLDGFKKVNDTLGHEAGDDLIRQAGARLCACIGTAGLVARMGGDEFAVLLPGCDEAAAVTVAGTILHSLSEPFPVDGQTIHIGASIGTRSVPGTAPSPTGCSPARHGALRGQARRAALPSRVHARLARRHPGLDRAPAGNCPGRWRAGSSRWSTRRRCASATAGSSASRP